MILLLSDGKKVGPYLVSSEEDQNDSEFSTHLTWTSDMLRGFLMLEKLQVLMFHSSCFNLNPLFQFLCVPPNELLVSVSFMNLVLFLLFLILMPSCINTRFVPRSSPNSSHLSFMEEEEEESPGWLDMNGFLGARSGRIIPGLSKVKLYLHLFSHRMLLNNTLFNYDDGHDVGFEKAILHYREKLGHPPSEMASPGCGFPGRERMSHVTEHYLYFPGKPRWSHREPMVLTYAFSTEHLIDYLSLKEIKSAFRRAFSRWASVIPVNFKEAGDYAYADIKIGFYGGDHGDGQPFDGVLGILAHSFSPESGRFHLDKAERWAVDFDSEQSRVAVDLESVAVHEIGHLLGLAHSPVKDAVMYPSLMPRERRVELKADDIEGVQALYGSRHKVMLGALLKSDTHEGMSNNGASLTRLIQSKWLNSNVLVVSLVWVIYLCYLGHT